MEPVLESCRDVVVRNDGVDALQESILCCTIASMHQARSSQNCKAFVSKKVVGRYLAETSELLPPRDMLFQLQSQTCLGQITRT